MSKHLPLSDYDAWKLASPDDGFDEDEPDPWDECGLGPDGQCANAGTEHCDWECPMRESEYFAGSKAWCAKHRAKP